MGKLVFGIGINDNTYPARVDGKLTREYRLWQNMLSRCTEKFAVLNKTYGSSSCSDNFKSYSYFYEWCNKQVGFGNKDENGKYWQLDKDTILKGNRFYSEATCVFIPLEINMLLNKSKIARGEYPIGVCWDKSRGKFTAGCGVGTRLKKNLGRFSCAEEAFLIYKQYKEGVVKKAAEKYKGIVDNRVCAALNNYEVNIND